MNRGTRRSKRRVYVNNALGVTCIAAIFAFPFALSWAESGRVPFDSSPAHVETESPAVDVPQAERFQLETPLPMCEEEDSPSCVWPADWMGNGEGHSFYADAENNVTFIEHGQWAYILEDGTYVVHTPPADAEYLP